MKKHLAPPRSRSSLTPPARHRKSRLTKLKGRLAKWANLSAPKARRPSPSKSRTSRGKLTRASRWNRLHAARRAARALYQ